MRVVRRTYDGGCTRLSVRRRLPAVPGLSFQRRERALSFYFPICRTARIPSVFFLVRLPSFSARTQGDKSGTYGWVVLMFLPHNPLIDNDLSALCLIFD